MISSVLVPLDGSPESEQAIPYAQAVSPDGGGILLVSVVPDQGALVANDPRHTEWQRTVSPGQEAPYAGELHAARAGLHQVIARTGDPRLTWSIAVAQGDPAALILKAIAQQDIGLVVMSTHGRGAFGRAIFGSVADRLVRTSPIPVLLVRPDMAATESGPVAIDRILVPLDGSELSEAALPVATELAQLLGIPVQLIRATNSTSVLATFGGSGPFFVAPPVDVYEQMATELEDTATAYLSEIATRLRDEGVDASWEVRDGSPYAEIVNAVQPGDLLVMTSHGRGGVMRWLLGSVAEKLVRDAPAPVLLVPAADRGTEPAGAEAEDR